MPSGTYNAPYAGDLRRDLMDAAIRSIANHGVAQLSLRAVARTVGVSHAAPKNHFPDKAALLREIAMEGLELLQQASEASGEAATSAVDELGRRGRAYVTFCLGNPGYFRVMWRNELLQPEPEALQDMGRAVFESLLANVVEAQSEGWAQHHHPADLALLAWTSVHGVAQLYLDGPLGDTDPRPPAAIADGLVNVLMRGLADPP